MEMDTEVTLPQKQSKFEGSNVYHVLLGQLYNWPAVRVAVISDDGAELQMIYGMVSLIRQIRAV